MKTKGIVTSEQISDYTRSRGGFLKVSKEINNELSLKSMLISCFAYGGISRDNYNFKRYIDPYKKEMSEEIFESIYEEMSAHFRGCSVIYAGQDSEGCSYNSVIIN